MCVLCSRNIANTGPLPKVARRSTSFSNVLTDSWNATPLFQRQILHPQERNHSHTHLVGKAEDAPSILFHYVIFLCRLFAPPTVKYRKLLWVAFLCDVFDRVMGDVVMWEGVVVPIVQCFAQTVVLPPPVDDD